MRLTAGVLLVAALAAPARGQLAPVTDRNYAVEFYQGGVIGGSRVIGMGGATVAVGEGAVGMPRNPASAAVRLATSRSRWDWDWNVDWLEANPGTSDFDNNGLTDTDIEDTLSATGGLVIQWRKWAFGISAEWQTYSVGIAGTPDKGAPQVALTHVVVARSFLDQQLTVGLGVRGGSFTMFRDPPGGSRQQLFTMSGAGPEVGVVWRPCALDLRAGATAAAQLFSIGGEIASGDYRPEDYGGYILPEKLVVPWELAVGAGYRFGGTRWNRRVAGDFRDERALVLAADLLLTGATDEGHGVEAFVAKQLQPAGRTAVLSVRGGGEIEAVPGWLRVRGGSYWEPSRFAGVDGRVHGTAGLDGRLWSFCLWGSPYRVRLSLTMDLARDYQNLGISAGLWH